MLKKVFCYSLIIALLSVLVIPTEVNANHVLEKKRDHNYPRLVNYYLGWTLTKSKAKKLSQWDVVVLDMENQERNPHLIKKMREWNPDIVILAYITAQEIDRSATDRPQVAPLRYQLYQGVEAGWYLKNSNGQRLSWWPGTYLMNVTNKSPSINGKRWSDHISNFVTNEILATDLWDGVFYDNAWGNISFFAGEDIDLNLDGKKESRQTANDEWRRGMKEIYNKTREKTDEHIILVGNNTTLRYSRELNGMMIENLSGSDWKRKMESYKFNTENRARPRINLINSNTGNEGGRNKYQKMRFGLASTLMENGYYSFDFGDKNHKQLWWYDEYSVGLGEPTGKADSDQRKYQRGVWTRSFEHGLAVLNSSNRNKTVELPGEYEHINGEAPINDGSIKSRINLKGYDGRILLKTFQKLENAVFRNGNFARFLDSNGKRVRNGFFTFEEKFDGGELIGHINIDENEQEELLRYRQGKLTLRRDDGMLYMREFPYSVNYQKQIDIEFGDLNGDGIKEIFVFPSESSNKPIKVYNRFGVLLKEWRPFGADYRGGYSLDLGNFGENKRIIVSAKDGRSKFVQFFTNKFEPLNRFDAYSAGADNVEVAAGNLDGVGTDEIITASLVNSNPIIKTFNIRGEQRTRFKAFSTLLGFRPKVGVKTTDVNFDGKEDIVITTEGAGF